MTFEMPLAHLAPVTSPACAADRWCLLLGLAGVQERELWVQVFDADGVQRAPVVVVDDLPVDPDRTFVENLLDCVGEVLARETSGIGSISVALARTEAADVAAGDLAWAAEVAGAARRRGVRLLAMHLVVVHDGTAPGERATVERLL